MGDLKACTTSFSRGVGQRDGFGSGHKWMGEWVWLVNALVMLLAMQRHCRISAAICLPRCASKVHLS